MRLLAELHYQLPRPLSVAEARVRDLVIPDAEAALADLQRSVQVCLRVPSPSSSCIPDLAGLPLPHPAAFNPYKAGSEPVSCPCKRTVYVHSKIPSHVSVMCQKGK